MIMAIPGMMFLFLFVLTVVAGSVLLARRVPAKALLAMLVGLIAAPMALALLGVLVAVCRVPQPTATEVPRPPVFLPPRSTISARITLPPEEEPIERDQLEETAAVMVKTESEASDRPGIAEVKAEAEPPAYAVSEPPISVKQKSSAKSSKPGGPKALVVPDDELADRAIERSTPAAEADRPAWVGREPFKENGVYYWPVKLEPRPSRLEAEDELLPGRAHEIVSEYATRKLHRSAYHPVTGARITLPEDYVLEHMIGDDVWAEPVDVSFGRWVQLHALLKFDRETNDMLRERWQEVATVNRLYEVGGAGALVLILLAGAWSYLKVDLATGGAYRWRLRAAVGLAVFAMLLLVTILL